MANECSFMIRAVARSRESLDRLEKILDYEDKEFYLYRVFSSDRDKSEDFVEDSLYVATFYGSVAWAAEGWVHDTPDPKDIIEKTGAHYSTFTEICPALDIGVEIYAEEEGCEFQECFRVNHLGELTWDECQHWVPYYDEDGDRDESMDEGGISGYLEWSHAKEIYEAN